MFYNTISAIHDFPSVAARVLTILAVLFRSVMELYLGYWLSLPLTMLVQSS